MTETQAWDLVAQTLGRLERKVDENLASLNNKVETKADKADVLRLDEAQRAASLANETRFVAIETAQASGRGVSEFISRFWIALGAGGAFIVWIVEKVTN